MEEAKKVPPKKPQEATGATLYQKLSKAIPKEFLYEYNDNGQTLTGYKSQYAIDLLNDVVGLGRWTTKEQIIKEETLKKGWTVAVGLKLSILEESIYVTGYGAHYSSNMANAYKGAKTSAFKNACRYLGIGKELHIKEVDDVVATQVAEEDLPTEQEGLAGKITESKSLGELELLLAHINKVEGEAVKKLLIKKYNDKKLKLT